MANAFTKVPLFSRRYPGLVALVDVNDYEIVSRFRWFPDKSKHTFYARANLQAVNGRQPSIKMHKLITGFDQVDHKDRNGLNNQRSNLREATQTENLANRATWGTSKFKGVSRSRGKWRAQISIDNKVRNLGQFTEEIEAARAYDRAALEQFGEFVLTNEMLGLLEVA